MSRTIYRLRDFLSMVHTSFFSLTFILSLFATLSLAHSIACAEAFTVACILPLSGRSAEYGVAAKNGIELAKKNRPDLFTNIRFLYEDSLYDGKTAITAFQRFSIVEHADLTFVWGHGPAQAVGPVAEAAGKAAIVITGQRDIADKSSFVVRYCSPHIAFANALLKEVRRRNYKKFVILKSELGFLNDTVEAFTQGLKSPETFELAGNVQISETDFQSMITKIKAKQADLLGLFLGEDQVPLFVSRMAASGLDLPLFGTHSLGNKNGISAIQRETEGAFFASNFVDESFHQEYSNQFGGDFQITWAANAYDFAMLTGQLFNDREDKPGSKAIVAAYQKVTQNIGVTGRYGFVRDETRGVGFVFPVVIKSITKNGIEQSQPEK